MSELPLIDKDKIFVNSPTGLVISSATSEWLEQVLDTLNFILQTAETWEESTHKNLARLILAINHEQSGCQNHEKCKKKLEAALAHSNNN